MKGVCLVLTTEQGNELGRLPLIDVAVPNPGKVRGTERSERGSGMDDLHQTIREALDQEGLEVILDDLDCRIAMSRALLKENDTDEVLIFLPVREAPDRPDLPKDEMSEPVRRNGRLDLDDLFNLDDSDGELTDD